MKSKVKGYLKEIRECEKLERRSSKKWAEIGTVEETIKMVKYQERKRRNNIMIVTSYGLGMAIAAVATAVKEKRNRIKQEEWMKGHEERMDLLDYMIEDLEKRDICKDSERA